MNRVEALTATSQGLRKVATNNQQHLLEPIALAIASRYSRHLYYGNLGMGKLFDNPNIDTLPLNDLLFDGLQLGKLHHNEVLPDDQAWNEIGKKKVGIGRSAQDLPRSLLEMTPL